MRERGIAIIVPLGAGMVMGDEHLTGSVQTFRHLGELAGTTLGELNPRHPTQIRKYESPA
jgi:hypothetical protein